MYKKKLLTRTYVTVESLPVNNKLVENALQKLSKTLKIIQNLFKIM